MFSSKGFPSYQIGVTGFEPATSWSRTKRSTKLSYTPSSRKDHYIQPRHDFKLAGAATAPGYRTVFSWPLNEETSKLPEV